MKNQLKKILILLFFISIFPIYKANAETLPISTNSIYVQDNANILNEETETYIQKKSEELKRFNGGEIAVVSIDSLNGENIDNYSKKLFNSWKIGDKEKNNGVLILIAKNDRKFRITLGKGVENIYIENYLNTLTNYFKKEDFNNGILSVFNSLFEDISKYDTQYNNMPKSNSIFEKEINYSFLLKVSISIYIIIAIIYIIYILIENKKDIKERKKDLLDKYMEYKQIQYCHYNDYVFLTDGSVMSRKAYQHKLQKEKEKREYYCNNIKNESSKSDSSSNSYKYPYPYNDYSSSSSHSSFDSGFGGGFSDGGGGSGGW